MIDYPKLRFVEVLPIESENGRMFALRDPSGLVEEIVVVSEETLALLQFFDGNHSLLDIRAQFYRSYGRFLPEQKLLKLVGELDRNHFLEGESFQEFKRGLEQEMLAQHVRPAAHAGHSYPAEPQELRAQLESFFAAGSGLPVPATADSGTPPTLAGLIAPHIDLRVGGACYTFAYRALAESAPVDVFVILATGHGGLYNCYSALAQDFATPLGEVKHDREFLAELARQHPHELFAEPLPHRSEHTIEFQTLFLQYLFGGRHPFTIVPILCSYAHLMLTDERFGREQQIITAFVTALRQTCSLMAAAGKRLCLVASVDFSHVGPRYGDRKAPDDDFLQQVREADQRLLEAVVTVQPQRFVDLVDRLNDRYRVCGFAPLHTLLSATTANRGRLLKYEQGRVDDRQSVVSYASAILY